MRSSYLVLDGQVRVIVSAFTHRLSHICQCAQRLNSLSSHIYNVFSATYVFFFGRITIRKHKNWETAYIYMAFCPNSILGRTAWFRATQINAHRLVQNLRLLLSSVGCRRHTYSVYNNYYPGCGALIYGYAKSPIPASAISSLISVSSKENITKLYSLWIHVS